MIELSNLNDDDQLSDDELEGFLTSSSSSPSKDKSERYSQRSNSYWYTGLAWYKTEFIRLVYCISSILFLVTCIAFLPTFFSSSDEERTSASSTSSKTNLKSKNINHRGLPVIYSCPKEVREAENADENFEKDYIEATKKITNNLTEFMSEFRDSNFDAWGHTYSDIKNQSTPFKSKYYPPNLKNGDTIYESACGIGLNLYMTLEILQKQGIEHLIVYGNEYIDVSTQKANAVFDHIAPAKSKKGIICTADSAHLEFIPSGAFDLVYTGYITPLSDPLKFGEANSKKYVDLCKIDKSWEGQKLVEAGQEKQESWYGYWVAEMSRIAKPGRPVIVEQVSYPYCEALFDWGGVSQNFWHESAKSNKYGWNIDPDSIEMMNDTIYRRRYHVFMRKKDDGR
jgi:hypothetical protein